MLDHNRRSLNGIMLEFNMKQFDFGSKMLSF